MKQIISITVEFDDGTTARMVPEVLGTLFAPPRTGTTKSHGTRFELTEMPPAWCAWCVKDLGWTEDHALRTFENFRDWWSAKIGRDALKADWFATWRIWCRRNASEVVAKPAQSQYPRFSRTEGIANRK